MHGTFVLMMALSGLGCGHKSADVAYAPSAACYGSAQGCYGGQYVSACYSAGGYGCYGGSSCYDSATIYPASCHSEVVDGGCYGGSCYGSSCHSSCYSRPRKGLFHGLFSCFRKNRSSCYSEVVSSGCYGGGYAGCYSSSAMPVYGPTAPSYQGGYIVDGSVVSGQGYPAGQGYSAPGATSTGTNYSDAPPPAPESTMPAPGVLNSTAPPAPGGLEVTPPAAPIPNPTIPPAPGTP